MLRMVAVRPERVLRWLDRSIPDDVRVVGSGSAHTVIERYGHVEKIHRRSAFLSSSEQSALAEQFVDLHNEQTRYVGDAVVPQTTTVAPHPLRDGLNVVVSRQPLVDFERLDIFRAHEPTIDRARLETAAERDPWLRAALRRVAQAGLKMHSRTGLLLDCSGMDNIVVATTGRRRLVCLDGLPISTGNRVDTRRILGQLNSVLSATSQR